MTGLIYRASLRAPHFHFEAYGADDAEAVQALYLALDRHTQQYRCAPDWYHEWRVETRSFALGHGYRDGKIIKPARRQTIGDA